MPIEKSSRILPESLSLRSVALGRSVQVDLYLPPVHLMAPPTARPITHTPDAPGSHDAPSQTGGMSLLLINDGQDLDKLGLADMLDELYGCGLIAPLLCVGIHTGPQRKMEYGTALIPDYLGRGGLARQYACFIFDELLPHIRARCGISGFKDKAFAGFSLGALSAMDIVWNHPHEFKRAGLFSGSFWWRTKDQSDPAYSDAMDRIMHRQIREGGYYPWLKFFFECGTADEQEDRNRNGVIDSIDDTQDLILELVGKGYDREEDIRYLQIEGGRHDVATWALAMPAFLIWGWGSENG